MITRYYFGDPPPSPGSVFTDAHTIPWCDRSGTVLSREAFSDLLQHVFDIAERGQGAPDPHFHILLGNHIAAGSMVLSSYAFDVPSEGKTGKDYEQHVAEGFRDRKKTLCEIVEISDEPGPARGHPWHGDSSSIMATGDTGGP